jgi:plasmid maintenance system antidote protein VapI
LRLAHFFGTSAEFWLNLQKLYELRLAEVQAGASIRRLPKFGSRFALMNCGAAAFLRSAL